MTTPLSALSMIRHYADELTDETYGDSFINDLFQVNGQSIYGAAAALWEVKASSFASLVDVSEAGSSRKLSDLRKNALEMAAYFKGKADEESGSSSGTRPRTRAIVRP